MVVGSEWELGQLLAHNRALSAQTRQALLAAQASPQAFVSWLLYAASPAGASIRQPALFAASQLRDQPQQGAGNPFDRLAQLPSAQLLEMLNTALEPPFHVSDSDWRQAMSEAGSKRLLALRRQLFGEAFAE